ncbi:MAG TPA: hypothetical protein VG937_30730 [Polyangiaceae bacterium]|nr:hypothetical protein [Polyangiaceae bacterium]
MNRAMTHAVPWSVILCALPLSFGLAACSGESSDSMGTGGSASGGSGSGGNGDPECLASVGPIDPTTLVDDLEDNNGQLSRTAGRNGSWWISTDGTDGTISPPADAAPSPERVPGGHCGSNFAMRVTGQGFTNWGAVLSAGFRYSNQAESIDASAFRGVMFWARTGDTNSSTIRVQFQDANTRPEGGVCNATPGTPDECYNGFGTDLVQLGTEWRLYKLDFSRMAQREFGYRADALDTAHLYDMEWNLQSSSIFDLWVDDIWFYE